MENPIKWAYIEEFAKVFSKKPRVFRVVAFQEVLQIFNYDICVIVCFEEPIKIFRILFLQHQHSESCFDHNPLRVGLPSKISS